MSLIDHYLRYLEVERRARARTVQNWSEILTRADRELPFGLEQANADELKRWLYREVKVGRTLRARSASTLSTYWGALTAFYQWAFDPRDPWLDGDNPWLWMPERPKRPQGVARPIENLQLTRILTEACEPYRLWALIAAYQGLRCCEIAGLDREHITQQRLLVVDGKGGKSRWHDTDPYVWDAVKDLPSGPIAIDWLTGQRATPKVISNRSAKYFRKRLGMPGVALHRMRHWLGVTVQAEYRDARVTQEVLGHASLDSTQIYTRATVDQQRAARATLPRLAG